MSRVRRVPGARTAVYAALMTSSGDLAMAVADMELHAHIDPTYLLAHSEELGRAPLCVADANLSAEVRDERRTTSPLPRFRPHLLG